MKDLLDFPHYQQQVLNHNYSFTPNSVPILEDKKYLTALLTERDNQIKNQKQQILQLKASAKEYLDIIEKFDEAVPLEESNISKLVEQNNDLQTKYKKLQLDVGQHNEKSKKNRSILQNKDQELSEVLNEQNEMKTFIDQSRQKQKDVNDHIMTLQSSCDLLTNDIENLKMNNELQRQAKHQFEIKKKELNLQNEKIEEIRKKQIEMAEYLSKTDLLIRKYQNKNLKTELELYDELKSKKTLKAKQNQLNINIEFEPEQIQQDIDKAQEDLKEKEIILQNEQELFTYNQEKINKLQNKLYKQKKLICHLKKQINLLETQIQQEQYLMSVIRQQHAQLRINTNQFSSQIEQSVKNIDKIKKEKKQLKKQLENAKNVVAELKNKISCANSLENNNFKERDPPIKKEIFDVGTSSPGSNLYKYDDEYQDNTIKTIDMIRKQSNDIKKNQKRMENIRYDQQFLKKRINNCHTGVVNKQYHRDSLFPTSRNSPK